MSDDRGTVRQIAFAELFPWLVMVRALRLAVQARLLLLSTVAVLLTMAGWWGIAELFSGDPLLKEQLAARQRMPAESEFPLARLTFQEDGLKRPAGLPAPRSESLASPTFGRLPAFNPLDHAWHSLTEPFLLLFAPTLSLTGLAFLILRCLWVVLVWAFFGGVITRLAALEVSRAERGSLRGAVRYVRKRYLSYFASPLYPLFGVLLFVIVPALLGLIGHAGAPGLFTLALIWPIFLVFALIITILLVGLLFGWPLMWPTISTEGSDSFDALSRTYSYVYQRPLYYGFLIVLASLLGAIGWFFVQLFASLVAYIAAWSVSWGASDIVLSPGILEETAPRAATIIGMWSGLVQIVALSFIYTFLFSAATIAYFLLRHQVDGTETDEVFLDEQPEKFGLPPVSPDPAGVPTVAPETSESADESSSGTLNDAE